MPAQPSTPSKNFNRWAIGGDLRLTLPLPVARRADGVRRGHLRGEPRSLHARRRSGRRSTATCASSAATSAATQELTQWAAVGVRYDATIPIATPTICASARRCRRTRPTRRWRWRRRCAIPRYARLIARVRPQHQRARPRRQRHADDAGLRRVHAARRGEVLMRAARARARARSSVAAARPATIPALDALLRLSNAQFYRGAPPRRAATARRSRSSLPAPRRHPPRRQRLGRRLRRSHAPRAVAVYLDGDVGYWVVTPGALDPLAAQPARLLAPAPPTRRSLPAGAYTRRARAPPTRTGHFGPVDAH